MTPDGPQRSLRYIGLGDSTGYAQAATALVQALSDHGTDIVWEPMLPSNAIGLGYAPAKAKQAGPATLWHLRNDHRLCDDVLVHFTPEYFPHFIARERASGSRRIIGHTIWETDRLPAHWPDLISRVDALLVPTEWNRQLFRSSGVETPILVVPHVPRRSNGVATEADRKSLAARLPDLGGKRIFYTISTWLERKGIDLLVEAFTRAFDIGDPVALIIKTTPKDLERTHRERGFKGAHLDVRPQFEAMIRRSVLARGRIPPTIHLLTDELSDGEIVALHELGDCFVTLFRAEGWGLGAFEAAAAGNPVISTGWGGPTAYLSPETAYLVDWSMVPVRPAEPNASYTSDQNWAEPIVGSAVTALRTVAADWPSALQRGARAARYIREAFDAPRVAAKLSAELASLPVKIKPMPVNPQGRNMLRSVRAGLDRLLRRPSAG